jgi:hypothetical protein
MHKEKDDSLRARRKVRLSRRERPGRSKLFARVGFFRQQSRQRHHAESSAAPGQHLASRGRLLKMRLHQKAFSTPKRMMFVSLVLDTVPAQKLQPIYFLQTARVLLRRSMHNFFARSLIGRLVFTERGDVIEDNVIDPV